MEATYLLSVLLFAIGFFFGIREAERGLSWRELTQFLRMLFRKVKGSLRKAR